MSEKRKEQMQAVINNNLTVSEKLDYLLSDVDSTTKNDVENSIVAMGEHVVDALVQKLRTLTGIKRGVVAMSLIRIGESSIAPLKALACEDMEHQWMADYLLSEI